MKNNTISKLFLLTLLASKSHAFTFYVECDGRVLCNHASNILASMGDSPRESHIAVLSELKDKMMQYPDLAGIGVNANITFAQFPAEVTAISRSVSMLGKKMQINASITRAEESGGEFELLRALKTLETDGVITVSISNEE